MSAYRCPDCGEGFPTTEQYHEHMDREHRPRRHAGEPLYLIWSEEHGAWWKAGWSGYTSSMREAGRYPLDVAQQICREANFGGQFNEVVVPVPAYPGA